MISDHNDDLKQFLLKAIEFHRIAQNFEQKGIHEMGKLMREKSQEYLEYYEQETGKLTSRHSGLDAIETGIMIGLIVVVVFSDVLFRVGIF